MYNFKKITSLLLIATILLLSVFACAKEDSGSTNNGGNNKDEESTPAISDGGLVNLDGDNQSGTDDVKADKWAQEPSNLPEANFEGREFNVISVEVADANRGYDYFAAEEQNGDPINDALYKRQLGVEEQYNINMNVIINSAPADAAKKSIMAGDLKYDLIVDTITRMKNLASQSNLADLYSVPYIKDNLGKAWWDQALTRDLAIDGKLYFQTGHIVLRDKLRLAVMYFNKDMFKSVGLDYPYQYVDDGTWTIDKMAELTKNVNRDINGDGVMDEYDQWGLMSQWENGLHMFSASGERTVSLNSDGVPEITINTQRAIEVIQKVLAVSTDGVTMYHADTIKGSSDIWIQASAYFQENRFLMRTSMLEPIVRDLRGMTTDFGILPYVKYDENQENYFTYVEGNGLVIGVPMNSDTEYSGLITEALAYASGSTLMPAFYDLCLTSKVLRDDESEGMLDIIFNNKVYDIGCIYQLGSLHTVLRDLVQSKSTDFISRFEKIQGAAEKALEKFTDTYGQE